MEALLVPLLIGFIIFCLVWYLIKFIPLPKPLNEARWVLYAFLIVAAIVYLLRFI